MVDRYIYIHVRRKIENWDLPAIGEKSPFPRKRLRRSHCSREAEERHAGAIGWENGGIHGEPGDDWIFNGKPILGIGRFLNRKPWRNARKGGNNGGNSGHQFVDHFIGSETICRFRMHHFETTVWKIGNQGSQR